MKLISISKENGYYIIKVEISNKLLNIRYRRKTVLYSWSPKNDIWLVNGKRKTFSHRKKALLKKWVKNHQTFIEDYN